MKVFIKPCAYKHQYLTDIQFKYLGKIVDVMPSFQKDVYQVEIDRYWELGSYIKLNTPELLEQYIKFQKK